MDDSNNNYNSRHQHRSRATSAAAISSRNKSAIGLWTDGQKIDPSVLSEIPAEFLDDMMNRRSSRSRR